MKPIESLKTPRTTIRRLQPADQKGLTELLCDKSVTQHMAFPDEMLTKEGVTNLLEMTISAYESERPLLSFAIAENGSGDFIGVTGFSPRENNEMEVFYAFLPKYWGKGFATEILASLTAYILIETDYGTVVAPITQNNHASIKVAEKNGFINCGLREDPNYKDLIFIFKKKKN
ncbi:GNAT family N-acetyltransferase [Fulvivirgaceae bacterium BMA12]|uniref:GNAT family N-acetyltransferase n=1 Tax=Agaribacillus aureus TaxID=3051825 RepID=A0ABT8LAF6_9BACT|nr:GNAT family N-acetyltransferase [Fulvivirgaceae bacterium BMA12]